MPVLQGSKERGLTDVVGWTILMLDTLWRERDCRVINFLIIPSVSAGSCYVSNSCHYSFMIYTTHSNFLVGSVKRMRYSLA